MYVERWSGAILALAAVTAGACAGKAAWDEAREVYVVSLPHGAQVAFEGKAAGTTPVSLALPAVGPDPGELAVTVELPGFRREVRTFPLAAAPDRLVVVLIPDVPGAPEEAPAPDDAEGFYRVAKLLLEAGRCQHALEYLDRTVELSPRHARAHRERGECFLALGEPERAFDHFARYLLLAPDAPDAEAIEARIFELRESRTIDLDRR
jgi:tetratricopeptide (TPR) repeat protein